MALESSREIQGWVPPLLQGAIVGATVSEVGGIAPSTNIRTDQDWSVKVDWNLEGSLLNQPFFNFVGDWVVSLFLESMGPSLEYSLNPIRLGVNTFTQNPQVQNRRDYTATIDVLAGQIDAGIYKLAVAITYESAPGTPGPIAGFHEGNMLQLYST